MSKRYMPVFVVFSLLGALLLGSCDNIFSTTWGTPREYDPSKITLSPDNLDAWVEQARKDPKLADAVLKKIKEKVDGATGAEKAKFQDAGVAMAVESAGIGNAIMGHLEDALDLADESGDGQKDAVTNFFDKVKAEVSDNCAKAAEDITAIIKLEGNPPKFSDEFFAKAKDNPSTAIQAMMVLTLAELGDKTMEDIQSSGIAALDGLSLNGSHIEVDSNASDGAKVLAAYINMIVDGGFEGNAILGSIRDMMLNN
ncbi:hypothetical protein AGMMS49928_05360 [Spirochaetia bacterium]|nr:hypothetical protein AGMMS49928_05360 [Spirochaetia bacterium]